MVRRQQRSTTHPASGKQANAFGLYDMNGNVWEWVEGIYHDSHTQSPSNSGSLLSSIWSKDVERVLRGGYWKYVSQYLRAASRNRSGTAARLDELGFRLVKNLP